MAHDAQPSINIPQLLAVAVVGFLAIRWFMSKPSAPGGGSNSGATHPNRRTAGAAIDPAKIERVASVFPQLDRRAIAWDLQRNGGNVEATTERVLAGRALDTPPPTFQPDIPAAPGAASGSGAAAAATTATGVKRTTGPAGVDLITRYGLQSRVGGKGKEAVPSEEQRRNAWSADKNARAEALKTRREEMILAARRKMMEKDAEA